LHLTESATTGKFPRGYVFSRPDAQEMCRVDETLRELVATWHRLTPTVRKKIMGVARATI